MPKITDQSPEETSAFLGNFIVVGNTGTNLATLGMTAAEITTLGTQKSDIDSRIVLRKSAVEAAKTATVNLNTAARTAQVNLSSRNRQITANPNVPASLKKLLGLTVPDTNPSDNAPIPPIELTVSGTPAGTNTLRWKRGTNKPGMQYVIEAKVDGATTWRLIDAVTATRFDHTGQTPGVPVVYRVRARRRGIVSEPSTETTIYG